MTLVTAVHEINLFQTKLLRREWYILKHVEMYFWSNIFFNYEMLIKI